MKIAPVQAEDEQQVQALSLGKPNVRYGFTIAE